jgi:taurine--2-oxoglutarate transaminase
MIEKDVLVLPGRPATQVIIAPPFCVDRSDIDQILEALDTAIASTFYD